MLVLATCVLNDVPETCHDSTGNLCFEMMSLKPAMLVLATCVLNDVPETCHVGTDNFFKMYCTAPNCDLLVVCS